MKIFYVTQFFTPENIAGAFRASDHSSLWAKAGHDVCVYTAYPNYPTGKIFEGYENQNFSEENVGNVRVLRNRIILRPNTSLINRIINGGSYYYYGAKNLLLKRKQIGCDFDIVLASSGPIFSGMLGSRCAKKMKVPFVIEFRDIGFEQMVATGSRRTCRKVKLMRALELSLCKKADGIVVLTNGFKSLLEENGICGNKIFVVPNGADINPVKPCDSYSQIRFGYFGTMGISQDVCRTIDLLKSVYEKNKLVNYLLIGEGAMRKRVEDKIANENNKFIEIMHGMSMGELDCYYEKIHFSVVSLRRTEAFKGTIPSKIFQSFARGVPVLFLGPEGEAANLVRESQAGLVLTGNDEENRTKLINFITYENWPERLSEMRRKALIFMEKKYSRTLMAEKMIEVLSIASGKNWEGKE